MRLALARLSVSFSKLTLLQASLSPHHMKNKDSLTIIAIKDPTREVDNLAIP